MSETNLDFARKERTEHNYDVYSYTISVVPPHFDHLKDLRHDLGLAEPQDFPDIDVFPLIKQGKVSDDKITFFFIRY